MSTFLNIRTAFDDGKRNPDDVHAMPAHDNGTSANEHSFAVPSVHSTATPEPEPRSILDPIISQCLNSPCPCEDEGIVRSQATDSGEPRSPAINLPMPLESIGLAGPAFPFRRGPDIKDRRYQRMLQASVGTAAHEQGIERRTTPSQSQADQDTFMLHRPAQVVALLCSLSPPLFGQTAAHPPMAKPVEHISHWHGEKVNDPFFWLREKSNPEVISTSKAKTPTPRP